MYQSFKLIYHLLTSLPLVYFTFAVSSVILWMNSARLRIYPTTIFLLLTILFCKLGFTMSLSRTSLFLTLLIHLTQNSFFNTTFQVLQYSHYINFYTICMLLNVFLISKIIFDINIFLLPKKPYSQHYSGLDIFLASSNHVIIIHVVGHSAKWWNFIFPILISNIPIATIQALYLQNIVFNLPVIDNVFFSIYKNAYKYFQFRVESMMLRLAKPLNYVPVSPSVKQRAHMRAPGCLPLIMEPESR